MKTCLRDLAVRAKFKHSFQPDHRAGVYTVVRACALTRPLEPLWRAGIVQGYQRLEDFSGR